ncbi:NUDIX hydrolase domain-like protein [Gaertneriomyces semiglobifer]|nr:NUDIX hydrolase domain-like protein [Gaertneriomyces semiglobifer]
MAGAAQFFAGNVLNRLGPLRSDTNFLQATIDAPTTKFIACRNLDALLTSDFRTAFLKSEDLAGVLNKAFLVFLGVDEQDRVAPVDGVVNSQPVKVDGRAYWAVDLSPDENVPETTRVAEELESRGLKFTNLRNVLGSLSSEDVGIGMLSHARALMDWKARFKFCNGCGRQLVSTDAGHKLTCTPTPESSPCPSAQGLHNFHYPRTDAVIIVAVQHPTKPLLLLGRNKRFPPKWYTALAGFIEPGETIEEAVRREVYEEAGVKVGTVQYWGSQPWPFPSSLMIGCLGTADGDPSTESSMKGLDAELEDAKWFSREEVQAAIDAHDNKPGASEAALRIPPPHAIAYHIIKAWATGWAHRPML